jgi:amidase
MPDAPSPLPEPAGSFVDAARTAPGRLRIALSMRIPYSAAPATLDPQVGEAVERLAGVLEGLGHQVDRADPSYGLVGLTFLPRSTCGLVDWVGRVPDPSLLDARTHRTVRMGKALRPLLPLSRALERPYRRRVGRIFQRFDVVLAPTTAKPALRVGAYDGLDGRMTNKTMVAACPYAWPWNVLGWPGLSVPAGLTGDGLPVGAQLLGPANSEPRLLSLAAQLEAEERWHERRPPPLA